MAALACCMAMVATKRFSSVVLWTVASNATTWFLAGLLVADDAHFAMFDWLKNPCTLCR